MRAGAAKPRDARNEGGLSHACGHLLVSRFARRDTENRETARSLLLLFSRHSELETGLLSHLIIMTRFMWCPQEGHVCIGVHVVLNINLFLHLLSHCCNNCFILTFSLSFSAC